MSRMATLISRAPSSSAMRRPIPLLPPVRITTSRCQSYVSLTLLFNVRLSSQLPSRLMRPRAVRALRALSRFGRALAISRPWTVYWARAIIGSNFQGSRRLREINLPSTSAVKPEVFCKHWLVAIGIEVDTFSGGPFPCVWHHV